MIESWQRIDKTHSVCAECCTCLENTELRGGLCAGCKRTVSDRRNRILAKANDKVVAKAAVEFMAAIQNHGKEGAAMPRIMDKFYEGIGGLEKFGEIMSQEFSKARGVGVGADQYEHNPKLVLAWFELACRHQSKVDEGKQLDVSGLDEEALESVLAGVAEKWVEENPEFQQRMFKKIMKINPDLANTAMEMSGSARIEAAAVRIVSDEDYVPEDDSTS